MAIRIEYIWNDKEQTLRDVALFVGQARTAGVPDDAVLEEVYEMDGREPIGWRVTPNGEVAPSQNVELPTDMVTRLLDFIRVVADGDGDVRGMLGEAAELREELFRFLLSPKLGLE